MLISDSKWRTSRFSTRHLGTTIVEVSSSHYSPWFVFSSHTSLQPVGSQRISWGTHEIRLPVWCLGVGVCDPRMMQEANKSHIPSIGRQTVVKTRRSTSTASCVVRSPTKSSSTGIAAKGKRQPSVSALSCSSSGLLPVTWRRLRRPSSISLI